MTMLEYITPIQYNRVYIDPFSAGQTDICVMNCSKSLRLLDITVINFI